MKGKVPFKWISLFILYNCNLVKNIQNEKNINYTNSKQGKCKTRKTKNTSSNQKSKNKFLLMRFILQKLLLCLIT